MDIMAIGRWDKLVHERKWAFVKVFPYGINIRCCGDAGRIILRESRSQSLCEQPYSTSLRLLPYNNQRDMGFDKVMRRSKRGRRGEIGWKVGNDSVQEGECTSYRNLGE